MYKHLLIAIDGSELSDKALKQGLELAKALSAKTTLLHVTAPWTSVAVGEIAIMFPPQEYEANMKPAAEKLLAKQRPRLTRQVFQARPRIRATRSPTRRSSPKPRASGPISS